MNCNYGCHVNPRDYVPVCPVHRLPLIAAEAEYGICPWVGPKTVRREHIGGVELESKRCHSWGPRSWVWVKRDLFNQSDLPPYNGHQPPTYDRTGGPTWEVADRPCSACRERTRYPGTVTTRHVTDGNRLVCAECGAMAWADDPLAEVSQ